MGPGYWLNEGGQSAFGAALDQLAAMHPATPEARDHARAAGQSLPVYLEHLAVETAGSADAAVACAGRYHMVPDFLGNRAPAADPAATAVIAGLTLDNSVAALADLHVAGMCGLACGLSQVLDAQRAQGLTQDTLVLSGGIAKSPLMRRILADATGYAVALPVSDQPVLLGASMLGAVASGRFADLSQAAAGMSAMAEVIAPDTGAMAARHKARRQIYDQLQGCEREMRRIMNAL